MEVPKVQESGPVAQQSETGVQLQQPLQMPDTERITPRAMPSLCWPDDVESIAPGQWLDSMAIYVVLERLARLHRGLVSVLDPRFVKEVMLANERGQDLDELPLHEMRCRVASVTGNAGMVWIPILLNNSHYILAVFRFEPVMVMGKAGRVVWVYDSLIGRDGQAQVKCLRTVQPVLNLLRERLFTYCNQNPGWVLNMAMCPVQENNTDCGVAVCLNAMYLAARLSTTHISVTSTRTMYWLCARRMILELCKQSQFTDDNELVINGMFLNKEQMEHDFRRAQTTAQTAIDGRLSGLVSECNQLSPNEQLYWHESNLETWVVRSKRERQYFTNQAMAASITRANMSNRCRADIRSMQHLLSRVCQVSHYRAVQPNNLQEEMLLRNAANVVLDPQHSDRHKAVVKAAQQNLCRDIESIRRTGGDTETIQRELGWLFQAMSYEQ